MNTLRLSHAAAILRKSVRPEGKFSTSVHLMVRRQEWRTISASGIGLQSSISIGREGEVEGFLIRFEVETDR